MEGQEYPNKTYEDFVDTARQLEFSEDSISYSTRIANLMKRFWQTSFDGLVELAVETDHVILAHKLQVTQKRSSLKINDLVEIEGEKEDLGIVLEKKLGRRYIVGLISPNTYRGENMDLIGIKLSCPRRHLKPVENPLELERRTKNY